MTFLESTYFFVRTVMFDFINRDKTIQLKFRLVPMIHIGTEEYYKDVLENLKDCDEIFYEGAQLKTGNLLFKQYKIVADKLGLVTQKENLNLKSLKGKLTHTDYNRKTGEEAWNELSLREKLIFRFVNPFRFFVWHQELTRTKLAKHFMTSNQEAYLAYGPVEDEEGTSANLIMNKRELIIFDNIKKRLKNESATDKLIGIVYGAGHMNSVARFLIDNFDYIPKNGKFMKVFDVI